MTALYILLMEFPRLHEVNPVQHLHASIVDLWTFISRECDYEHDSLIDARRQIVYILRTIRNRLEIPTQTIDHAIHLSILENMFCFIAHTRDIHCGLGHRKITYMMLDAWYECYPILAIRALRTILIGNNTKFGYGSWRDVCGLYDYCIQHSRRGEDNPLIDISVGFMNSTLRKDWRALKKHGVCNTNVAKWVPREKSRHHGLFTRLAHDWGHRYTPHIMTGATTVDAEFAAIRKCKMLYRKTVVSLTRLIDPLEQKMCSREIGVINSDSIPDGSFAKNWDWLRDQTLVSLSDTTDSPSQYTLLTYGFSFPTHLDKYVSYAIRSIEDDESSTSHISEDISRLNTQWEYISNKWNGHVNASDLAIICLESISIRDPQLHRAIAHACIIAQKSGIKRILYASHDPVWINLENCDGFVAYIRTIYNALRDQAISCSNLNNALTFIGENHPFSPIIITQTGYCYRYDSETEFNQFFEIMDSKRYESMQNAYRNTILAEY